VLSSFYHECPLASAPVDSYISQNRCEGPMTPHDYYEKFVEPSWQDFLADTSSIRHAKHVAEAGYHMVDYIARTPEYMGPNKNDHDQACKKVCKDVETALGKRDAVKFKIVQNMAIVFKHSIRRPPGKGKPDHLIDDVNKIELLYMIPWSSGVYFSDGVGWASDTAHVSVMGSDGYRYSFEHCMRMVLETWQRYLASGKFEKQKERPD
jgi:hypothetical protein